MRIAGALGLAAIAATNLGGCSGKAIRLDAGAQPDGGGGTGGAPATDASDSAADAGGGGGDAGGDAGACPAEVPHDPLTASTSCAAAVLPLAAAVCPGATACPVTVAYRLTCSGGGLNASIAPGGTTGGSVLLVTNSGAFVSHLFTLAPGAAPRVDDVPLLDSTAILTEAGGARAIVTANLGLELVRETPTGWLRSEGPSGPAGVGLTAAYGVASGDVFAAYFDANSGATALASRHGSCWSVAPLPGPVGNFTSIDVDAMNRPWVAGTTFTETGGILEVVGPDGTAYQPSPPLLDIGAVPQPLVLAGGISRASAFPTLVIQREDGVHLLEANGATATWSDRTIAGSATALVTGDCPDDTVAMPTAGCASLTSCAYSRDGAVEGYALARTASGKTFVAWGEATGSTSYALTCQNQGLQSCHCTRSPTTSTGSGAVTLARVDANAATKVLRIAFAAPYQVLLYDLAMTSRGETLLVVAHLLSEVGIDTDMRYFEIDASGL